MSKDTITQVQLSGHKGSVNCLIHSSSSPEFSSARFPCCLLSGSDDKTARLWDLRAPFRASMCIMAGGEVTSVAFAPPPQPEVGLLKDPVEETHLSPFSRNCVVYVSVDNRIHGYDLRMAQGPIVSQFSTDLSHVLSCPDEINQLILCNRRSRNSKLHLAAAEDGGSVRCVVTQVDGKTQPPKVLWHDPDKLSMVTSAVFRPKAKGCTLASGGTDCMVHLWDLDRPKKPASSCHITQDTSGANQICNPPMVHSLAWSPSGRLLAAGLGDGTCDIFRVGGGGLTLQEVARLAEAHTASVASVVFPDWQPQEHDGTSPHVASQDRLLASAGTDGAIFLWDLGESLAGEGAVDPSTVLSKSMVGEETTVEDQMEQLNLEEGQSDCKLLFGIPHKHKANWMVTSHGVDPVFPSTLFVADTSPDITAYTVPLQ